MLDLRHLLSPREFWPFYPLLLWLVLTDETARRKLPYV
jgi:hypothetical protein